jgi:hypothetical protein
MECNLDMPVNFTGSPPLGGEPFAFSHSVCTNELTEQITGTGDFYITKSIDYGQVIILSFVLIFFVLFVVKFLWNFVKQDSNEKI